MASEEFRQEVAGVMDFPVTRLGMCYDGSRMAGSVYDDNYNVMYAYTRGIAFSTVPGEQGHVWVLVEDPAVANTWAAVDSYYGVVTDGSYYTCYRVSSNFADIEDMVPSVELPVPEYTFLQ